MMLDKDPRKRVSAGQLLNNPYFQPKVDTKTLLQPIYNFIDGVNFMLHTMTMLT